VIYLRVDGTNNLLNVLGSSDGYKVSPGKTGPGEKGSDTDFKQALDRATASGEDKALKEAAGQLEALMLYQVFSRMRETVSAGGLFNESMGEKIFRGLLEQEISMKAAETGSIGLADMIYEQLKRK